MHKNPQHNRSVSGGGGVRHCQDGYCKRAHSKRRHVENVHLYLQSVVFAVYETKLSCMCHPNTTHLLMSSDQCACVFAPQLFGAVIMGFGLWLLLDNQSFIVVLSKFLFRNFP